MLHFQVNNNKTKYIQFKYPTRDKIVQKKKKKKEGVTCNIVVDGIVAIRAKAVSEAVRGAGAFHGRDAFR